MIKQEAVQVKIYAKSLLQPGVDTVHQLTQNSLQKLILTGAMGAVTLFIKDHLAGFMVLISLVFIDWISGMAAALHQGKFSSFRFRAGIFKIFVYALLVVAFFLFETINETMRSLKVADFCILYLAATEALSIIENAQTITGFQLPSWLKKVIDVVKRP